VSPAARVLCVFGTRPEAIKMAPVVMGLAASDDLTPIVAVTAQHRSMLDQVLDTFGLTPDHDLDIGRDGQTLADITCRSLEGLTALMADQRPDLVVLQGDTTSAFTAALAGYYERVPAVHVEAGLRTGNPMAPYPEEINRRLISQLAALHLAPTPSAVAHLRREGIPGEAIVCTGNTVIDALAYVLDQPAAATSEELRSILTDPRRMILVTVHRRESWGEPMAGIARALATVARANPDVVVVLPAHKNPTVRATLEPALNGIDNVKMIEPLPYAQFVRLLQRSDVVVTDSGGIQEEAPSLGKPVLVLRDVTERPEAVIAGTVALVGTDEQTVTARLQTLLDDPDAYAEMAQARNPYGDGQAVRRTLEAIRWFLGRGPRPDDFAP
jgi:UDP-N-acetylglucosamine 2-epimerase (non-hydrolysing)